MASYSVQFVRSAHREFERLPTALQKRALEALAVLAQNPRSELLQVKKLKGADALYRIRLGDYRIVFTLQHQALIILVIKIGHRRDVYRKL